MAKKRASDRKITSDGYVETGVYRTKMTLVERVAAGLESPDALARKSETTPKAIQLSGGSGQPLPPPAQVFTDGLIALARQLVSELGRRGFLADDGVSARGLTPVQLQSLPATPGGHLLLDIGGGPVIYALSRPIEPGTEASEARQSLYLIDGILRLINSNPGAVLADIYLLGRTIERLKVRGIEHLAGMGRDWSTKQVETAKRSAKLSPSDWAAVAAFMLKATTGRRAISQTAAAEDAAKKLATGRMPKVKGTRDIRATTIARTWQSHKPPRL